MAVYEVKSPTGETSLVECRTSKSAVSHVANKGYVATTLKMSDVVKRIQAGEKIESIEEDKVEKEPKPDPILDHIEAAEADKEHSVGEDVKSEDVEQKRSFSGRFAKKTG